MQSCPAGVTDENMSKERLFQLRQEAVALIKKGGLSAKIGHAFLKSNQGA